MKRYMLQTIQIDNDVVQITLKPRKNRDALHFEPGQYAAISFSRGGRPSPTRCFSLVGSADSELLSFAMRINGSFTQSVAELSAGTTFFVRGPYGGFTIDHEYDQKIVLIAGGIGITPFMSMLRSPITQTAGRQVTVLYSYRAGHHIPFHDELRKLESERPNLRVYMFVTVDTVPPNIPRMLSGRMTSEHITQVTRASYNGSTYFICGPNGFMSSVGDMLLMNHVDPDKIVTESFTQSSSSTFGSGMSPQKLTYAFSGALLLAGIVSITAIDLIRYIPRYEAAATVTSTSQPNSVNAQATTPPSSSSASSMKSTSTTPTSTSQSSPTTTPATPTTTTTPAATTAPTTTYREPVTSVS